MEARMTIEGERARLRVRIVPEAEWSVMGAFAPEGGVLVDVRIGALSLRMSPVMALQLGNSLTRCGKYWAPRNEETPATTEGDGGSGD